MIVAETVEMEAHRVVLAACSPYFCAMFTGTLQQTLHWGTVNGLGGGIRLWGSTQNITHRKVTVGLGLLWVVFYSSANAWVVKPHIVNIRHTCCALFTSKKLLAQKL